MSEETVRIPALGAIFWTEAVADGSAANQAIAGAPPQVAVTLTSQLPPGAIAVTGSRGVIIRGLPWIEPPAAGPLPAPTPAPTATPAPSTPPLTVSGVVRSTDNRFNPRMFSVTPSSAAPSYVALRPSLRATRIGEAGAVAVNMSWQSPTAPAPPASWSVLQLTCNRDTATYVFSGQADVNGDVVVPLTGLPPLPQSQTSPDQMTMTALGDPAQSRQSAADPNALKAVNISLTGTFAATQTLAVPRGQISNFATLLPASGQTGVVLQSN